jgi:predicted ribosome quality control (RQC) complex YloA/Tae2 family protein
VHNNYFFLRNLSAEIHQKFSGARIGEVFSQNKDELVLLLYTKEEDYCIKALLDPKFCCLSFPEQYQRAKKNSVDLFEEIIDFQILEIRQIKNDRSFVIFLENNYALLFKMYGNHSNILLLKEHQVISAFKNKLQKEETVDLTSLDKEICIDKARFMELSGDYKKLIPTFGNSVNAYFNERDYEQKDMEQKWRMLNDLLKELEHPGVYISTSDGLPVLRVYKDQHTIKEFSSYMEAVTSFFNSYAKEFHLNTEKSSLIRSFERQIKKTESYLSKSVKKLEDLKNKISYQMMADLIMANLYNIPKHSEEVMFNDFYTGRPVKIPLKRTLSPEKNAQNYYRKSKNQKLETGNLEKNIEGRTSELNQLKEQLGEVRNAENIKELRKYLSGNKVEKKENLPYKRFVFMDYDILVGKGSNKNDHLTFHVADKNDLFLHIKDAPGAHVIIRLNPGQNIPAQVIERAAGIAAYYSKQKNNSLCSVSYTPRKYVRKPKGFPPGKVIFEKEQVVLVAPYKPE